MKPGNETSRCAKCGAALPPGEFAARCPSCLLEAGLQQQAQDESSHSVLSAGSQIGPYRIEELLGSGGAEEE